MSGKNHSDYGLQVEVSPSGSATLSMPGGGPVMFVSYAAFSKFRDEIKAGKYDFPNEIRQKEKAPA